MTLDSLSSEDSSNIAMNDMLKKQQMVTKMQKNKDVIEKLDT